MLHLVFERALPKNLFNFSIIIHQVVSINYLKNTITIK